MSYQLTNQGFDQLTNEEAPNKIVAPFPGIGLCLTVMTDMTKIGRLLWRQILSTNIQARQQLEYSLKLETQL